MDITATVKVEMREVAKTVRDVTPCILYHRSKTITLDRLLYFEPYSTLGKDLLTSFFDSENSTLQQFVYMLQVPNSELLMYQETWRDNPTITYLNTGNV